MRTSVAQQMRERQRRSRRQARRLLLRSVLFSTSLLPALFVAWKLDLLPIRQAEIVQRSSSGTQDEPSPAPNVRQPPSGRRPTPPQSSAESDGRRPLPGQNDLDFESIPNQIETSDPHADRDQKPIDKPEYSATVPLTLTQWPIRVIAISDSLSEVKCDVSFSGDLLGQESAAHLVVAENLKRGDSRDLLFVTGIANVTAGTEVKVLVRGKSIVAELRPKYVLPSGDNEQFAKAGGVRKHRQLTNALNAANAAKAALPGMLDTLSQLQAAHYRALQVANAPVNTSNPGVAVQAAATKAAAARQATALAQQGVALENRIANAETLINQLPAITTDLVALEHVSNYGAAIADRASIAIRFHLDGETLPAEVR